MNKLRTYRQGFTLIELSIVLVIIGLIVGGVLVGRDLIKAAEVRAQVTQIEKYNQAVNTFRGKYGYLPGDIPDPDASRFGFAPRVPYGGGGDGNGVIQGLTFGVPNGLLELGEPLMFWVDLSTAHLIDGSFNSATSNGPYGPITSTGMSAYLPAAKIGGGNYLYVWSDAINDDSVSAGNYYSLAQVTIIQGGGYTTAYPAMTVQQAYNIDKKIDDGLPTAGKVQAMYLLSGFWNYAAGGGTLAGYFGSVPPSTYTCFDNNGSTANPFLYSITFNNGTGMNCALSFKFQ